MGWTSYRATYYKNGKIDRKAECDAYFMEGLNRGHYKVLKSAMVGSTYYAAVQAILKSAGKDENGEYKYEPIPENERRTFGVVFLTSTDRKDYFNFAYKDMDESCGPCQCDCPKGILDLLSPTDNEWALNWRKACYENIAKKKNPNTLNKLPVGSVIKVIMPFNTKYFSEGAEIKLAKRQNWHNTRSAWYAVGYSIKFTAGLMKMLEDHYEIIQKGA